MLKLINIMKKKWESYLKSLEKKRLKSVSRFVYRFMFNTALAFFIAGLAIKLKLNVGLTLVISVVIFEAIRFALRRSGFYLILEQR